MLIKTIAEQPETGRALISLDIPPLITPAIYEAWQNYPEQARAGIIDRLPWGGLYIRFSDLQHIEAAGTCGSDVIRISRDYLEGELTPERRAELINTLQHELTHFYLGHPTQETPYIKDEMETRLQLIEWDLDRRGDHVFIDMIARLIASLERLKDRINGIDHPWQRAELISQAAGVILDETGRLFTDREKSVYYLMELAGIETTGAIPPERTGQPNKI